MARVLAPLVGAAPAPLAEEAVPEPVTPPHSEAEWEAAAAAVAGDEWAEAGEEALGSPEEAAPGEASSTQPPPGEEARAEAEGAGTGPGEEEDEREGEVDLFDVWG